MPKTSRARKHEEENSPQLLVLNISPTKHETKRVLESIGVSLEDWKRELVEGRRKAQVYVEDQTRRRTPIQAAMDKTDKAYDFASARAALAQAKGVMEE